METSTTVVRYLSAVYASERARLSRCMASLPQSQQQRACSARIAAERCVHASTSAWLIAAPWPTCRCASSCAEGGGASSRGSTCPRSSSAASTVAASSAGGSAAAMAACAMAALAPAPDMAGGRISSEAALPMTR